MPDSTVRQDGSGDFTTLAAALADAGTGAGDTITIEDSWTIDDTTVCVVADDNITIIINLGNISYHDGFYNESNNHYRLVCATNGSHCIQVNNAGCIIDGLAIHQNSTGGSDECIRMANDGGTLTLDNLICFSGNATVDQDAIHAGSISATINVTNVIIYDFRRAGCAAQIIAGIDTQTWNINSCTFFNCASDGGAEENLGGGISVLADNSNATYNMNVFNTIAVDCHAATFAEDYQQRQGMATVTWNIDNCMSSDATIIARDAGAIDALQNRSVNFGSSGGGDEVIFVSSSPIDLLLIGDATNNDAQDAHSNTSGAGLTLPILDIATDIRERGANQIDIGADSVPPPTPPPDDSGLPEYGQGRAAIGDPPVYGATIVRS